MLDASPTVATTVRTTKGSIEAHDPQLLTFSGTFDQEDNPGPQARLIVHVSQLNLALVAVKKDVQHEEPRRIGFHRDSGD